MKKINLDALTSKYAGIVEKEKAIAEEKKQAGEEIKNALRTMNLTSATTPLGIFSIVVSSVWKFSKKVVKLEEQLSSLKEKEKSSGIAKKTPSSETVRFIPKK